MTTNFKTVISREHFYRFMCIMIFSATEKSNNYKAIRFLAPRKDGARNDTFLGRGGSSKYQMSFCREDGACAEEMLKMPQIKIELV
jgi:hypothetical protein